MFDGLNWTSQSACDDYSGDNCEFRALSLVRDSWFAILLHRTSGRRLMQLHSLLLGMATPLAVSTARSVGSLAASAGQSFAEALDGIRTAASGTAASGTVAENEVAGAGSKKPTVSEQLEAIAGRLRKWFGEHGMQRPFELNLAVDAGGEEQLDIAGEEAPSLQQLLQQRPDLRAQLSQLAASLQAMTGALGAGSVNLMINDDRSQPRAL